MTRAEFEELPCLLFEHEVMRLTGYARPTVRKMIDCGVLRIVKPAGCGQAKLQKIQVARLVGLMEFVVEVHRQFKAEPMLLPEKTVLRWTGYNGKTLQKIAEAGGAVVVRPPGLTGGRYQKWEIAEWIGLTF